MPAWNALTLTPRWLAKTVALAPAFVVALATSTNTKAQTDPNKETGQWTMLFWNAPVGDSRWLAQGDLQNRTRELGKDVEQRLFRTSIGYRPRESSLVLSQGYALVDSQGFGAAQRDSIEHRSYQELLAPQKLGERVYLTHRVRLEQRWVEGQDFRTRARYFIAANIPLNQSTLDPGAVYLALYNEAMINGERDVGGERRVRRLDRNRAYGALGYTFAPGARVQLGIMRQNAQNVAKNQLQLGLHLAF